MTIPFSADEYRRALEFAARAHKGQLVPGSELPYLVHLASVASEVIAAALSAPFDRFHLGLAVTCALLHDTLEDTKTTEAEVESAFGTDVLHGVRALTKNAQLPKAAQMDDSLLRILKEPREVAMVKLCDRINNLQEPPHYWTREKRIAYQQEARRILAALGPASEFLRNRLSNKIEEYGAFIEKA